MRIWLAIALTLALTVPAVAASTATAAPPAWLDPFCAVHAEVVPWNATANAPATSGPTDTYRVQLVSQKVGSQLDAHVTLADDSDLYNARIRSAPLSGSPYEQQTPAYLVTLPKPVSIGYAFVASYFVDDSPQTACPAEVSLVGPPSATTTLAAPAGHAVTATLARPLGTLACGKVYSSAHLAKGPPTTGGGANPVDQDQTEEYAVNQNMWQPIETDSSVMGVHTKATADVVIFLDMDGMPVNSYVASSTGTKTKDDTALAAARAAAYAPATFLCAPTVGHYVFQANFAQ